MAKVKAVAATLAGCAMLGAMTCNASAESVAPVECTTVITGKITHFKEPMFLSKGPLPVTVMDYYSVQEVQFIQSRLEKLGVYKFGTQLDAKTISITTSFFGDGDAFGVGANEEKREAASKQAMLMIGIGAAVGVFSKNLNLANDVANSRPTEVLYDSRHKSVTKDEIRHIPGHFNQVLVTRVTGYNNEFQEAITVCFDDNTPEAVIRAENLNNGILKILSVD